MDVAILEWLNQFARRSPAFDTLVNLLTYSNIVKGGVPMAVWWVCWFRLRELAQPDETRSRLLAMLVGAPVAILVGRTLALALPFRTRPIHEPSLDFVIPISVWDDRLSTWSSLPSDHAVLTFALVAGFFAVNRRLGLVLAAYVVLFVCVPRVYVGLHYPSDILLGALTGLAAGALLQTHVLRIRVARAADWLEQRAPYAFYAFVFLATMQTSIMFQDVRALGLFAIDRLHNLLT